VPVAFFVRNRVDKKVIIYLTQMKDDLNSDMAELRLVREIPDGKLLPKGCESTITSLFLGNGFGKLGRQFAQKFLARRFQKKLRLTLKAPNHNHHARVVYGISRYC